MAWVVAGRVAATAAEGWAVAMAEAAMEAVAKAVATVVVRAEVVAVVAVATAEAERAVVEGVVVERARGPLPTVGAPHVGLQRVRAAGRGLLPPVSVARCSLANLAEQVFPARRIVDLCRGVGSVRDAQVHVQVPRFWP